MFKIDSSILCPCGWVNQAGDYYPVDCANHDEFARKYLIEKYGKKQAYELRIVDKSVQFERKLPFYEVLEHAGWVKILSWPEVQTEFVFKKLTHAQKQTLFKYCTIWDEKLPFDDPLFKK